MTKPDPDAATARLLELIKERARRARRSQRDLERELELGHGTLGSIFRGRTELRFRHVSMLGRVLGYDPAELVLEAFGVAPPEPPPVATFTLTREELRALIAEGVRQELDRRDAARQRGGRREVAPEP